MTAERFPVEAGHILLFARAIADPNPAYRGESPVAPPTFVQASAQFDDDNPLRWRPDRPWMGSGGTPSQLRALGGGQDAAGGGSGGAGLHAEQHFEYHRMPRAGDVLTASVRDGERWEKEGRRGGRLRFFETITEFRDDRGELVVTARSVGVATERVPEVSS